MNRLNPNRELRFVPLILALFAGLVATACGPAETRYPTLNGEYVTLSDWHGKVVFINYWAEWCRPCRAEIPELNTFAQQYSQDAKVFSVNFDGVNGADLVEQVAAMGIEFDTLLADPRNALGALPSAALPETLVIGRQGQLHQVLLGPQTLKSLKEVFLSVP